jgi:hypothetical protein
MKRSVITDEMLDYLLTKRSFITDETLVIY